MVDLLATAAAVSFLLQPIPSGKATHYREGLMDRVVANRVRWGQLDLSLAHVGYVALADKRWIGRRVILQTPDGQLYGPLLVSDCGQAAHQQWLRDIGFAVDLSYELAEALDTVGKPLRGVKVSLWSDWPPEAE